MSVRRNELHLLTGGHALDALPEDDRAGLERHLARCPSCMEEVRGLRETAARLAMAPALYPPPEMRERVLATALSVRQLPPPGRGTLGRAGGRTSLRRLGRPRAGLAAGLLALAAAVAFLLVMQVSTSGQLRQARNANQAIAAVLAAPDARLESLQATVGGTVTAVVSLRDRAGRRHHGGPATPGRQPGLPALGDERGGDRQVGRPARGHRLGLGRPGPRRRRPARRPARHHGRAGRRHRAAHHHPGRHRAGNRVAGRGRPLVSA